MHFRHSQMLHGIADGYALRIEHRSFRRDEHFDLHAAISGARPRWTSTIRSLETARCAVRNHLYQSREEGGRRNAASLPITSRTTCVGFLSSRNPRKTGWRSFPSRVHSANFTWQTKTGFTHSICRIIAGVIPWTHCPPCFEGKSANGTIVSLLAFQFLVQGRQ